MKKQFIIALCLSLFTTTYATQIVPNSIFNKKEMIHRKLLEKRKMNVQIYFEKIDKGEFDDQYYQLFTEDLELYFPKFEFAFGKEGIKEFGQMINGFVAELSHERKDFKYVISENFVVVEGKENRIHDKKCSDNIISFNKFCNVFEFEGELIKRVHVYLDCDFNSEDTERISVLNKDFQNSKHQSIATTKEVIELFYDIQFGRKKGDITDLFSDEVDWDLPGNEEKFPWVGKRTNKAQISTFFKQLLQNVTSEKFEIDFISINGENATAVGNLTSKIIKYDKSFSTEFVVIFKVIAGKIVKYHFLEDSYKLDREMQN